MYHYTECGLNKVWLLSGYQDHDTPYGKGVYIQDADGLHEAIARWLITCKPRLSGGEFRFLRKELDLSQAGLASIFGNNTQSIARWEKKGHVPKMADRFLRALYREHADGNASIRDIVSRLNEIDQQTYEKVMFEETPTGWEMCAA